MRTRVIEIGRHIASPPARVRDAVLRPATMVAVALPLVDLRPRDLPVWPETRRLGLYRARLVGPLGLALGGQMIGLEVPPPHGATRIPRDNGRGDLARTWDHVSLVAPDGTGTRCTDRLRLDAGHQPPLAAPVARAFFAHRQGRLAALVTG